MTRRTASADPLPDKATAGELWTIGHWTCPESVFVAALQEANIQVVVDVRSFPGSRRSPQFGGEVMGSWLDDAGIGYMQMPELGGRRRKQLDVDPLINAGWENDSFKNYADYTLTPAYEEGIDRLMALAREQRVAVMCGEPMPWRCHRSLISNTFVARGWTVWHLSSTAKPRQHELGRWGAPAEVNDGVVTYPPQPTG
ncbi:MAG: DUF488 domain-containing protein [Dermatophilus congolensis]|nr:DUF488 domain-containing protein [Dermatophilus congolensis]